MDGKTIGPTITISHRLLTYTGQRMVGVRTRQEYIDWLDQACKERFGNIFGVPVLAHPSMPLDTVAFVHANQSRNPYWRNPFVADS